MIYMPMRDLEMTIEILGPRERGLALKILADQVSTGDAQFLPNYWKRPEYNDWLRLYGRTLLRKWYADCDDPKAQLVIPTDQKTSTIWDYFHQPLKVSPAEPWFVRHWAFNMNHRGLLLRRNWEQYHNIFRDICRPPVESPSLIPGIHPNTWIIDGIPTEYIPPNTQPKPWKDPNI